MKTSDKLARSELSMETEINKCVLCYDAPCKKIYKNIKLGIFMNLFR